MKKIKIILILLSFLWISNVLAKENVTLAKCVDGDTAWFYLNDEKIKARFLAIDTPESTNKIEPYGKEASNFTCTLLTNAKKIEIEYDKKSDKYDKYDRHLVWVFVDDELLQDLIIKEGLGKVTYLYGDYTYTNQLQISQIEAKKEKKNIWSESNDYLYFIIVVIILIIIYIFNKKGRNKINKKLKSKMKKEINKKIGSL